MRLERNWLSIKIKKAFFFFFYDDNALSQACVAGQPFYLSMKKSHSLFISFVRKDLAPSFSSNSKRTVERRKRYASQRGYLVICNEANCPHFSVPLEAKLIAFRDWHCLRVKHLQQT